MGGSGDVCVWVILAVILSPLILQIIGVANSDWLESTSCSELHNKSPCCNASNPDSYNDDCGGSLDLSDISTPLYSLQISAAILISVPVVCFFCMAYCDNEDNDCWACIGGAFMLFYPVAGLLGLIGCIIFAAMYPGQKYGFCFRMCLAAGLMVLAESLLIIVYGCCKGKRSEDSGRQEVAIPPQSQQIDRPSGGQIFTVRHMTEEVVTRETSHGSLVYVSRRFNVFYMLRH